MMKESITQKCASQFQLPDTCLLDKTDCAPAVERSHERSKGTVSSGVQTLAMLRCLENLGDVPEKAGLEGSTDPTSTDFPWQDQPDRQDQPDELDTVHIEGRTDQDKGELREIIKQFPKVFSSVRSQQWAC